VNEIKWSGDTVKDTVCIGAASNPCVSDYEFFVIQNDTAQRQELQGTAGIMGMAPDSVDDGPAFLTALKTAGLIGKLQVSFLMTSL
jgi:hypothetical protein